MAACRRQASILDRAHAYSRGVSDRHKWISIKWCHVALLQIDRVWASWTAASAAREERFATLGIRRVFASDARPMDLFLGDVQFLMIAVRHLRSALRQDADGAQLPEPLGSQSDALRHLLEHWQGAAAGTGAWKGLQAKHGVYATPTQVLAEPCDLKIGPEQVSVARLRDAIEEMLAVLTRDVAADPKRRPRTRVWVAGEGDRMEEAVYPASY